MAIVSVTATAANPIRVDIVDANNARPRVSLQPDAYSGISLPYDFYANANIFFISEAGHTVSTTDLTAGTQTTVSVSADTNYAAPSGGSTFLPSYDGDTALP